MAANSTTIDAVTYSSTDTDTAVTLTDDAFGIVHAIKSLTEAIELLTRAVRAKR